MRLWWLSLSLLTVGLMSLHLKNTFKITDLGETTCQEILCGDWAPFHIGLRKHGRCFFANCMYIGAMHRIKQIVCLWVYRRHYKENIFPGIIPSKVSTDLFSAIKHTKKQFINVFLWIKGHHSILCTFYIFSLIIL